MVKPGAVSRVRVATTSFPRFLPTNSSLFFSTYRNSVFWRILSGLVGDNVEELQLEIVAFEPIDLAVINLDLLCVWEAVATRNAVACGIINDARLYRTRVLHHSSVFISNIMGKCTLNKRSGRLFMFTAFMVNVLYNSCV